MDRYKIHDIKYYDVGANLFLGQNGQIVRNQIVPLDFVYGLRPGDVVRGLGRRDLMLYHTAFSCRGRLYLVLEPMGDGYRDYVSRFFDAGDRIYFGYALARNLISRGIMPTLDTAKNLGLFLDGRTGKIR